MNSICKTIAIAFISCMAFTTFAQTKTPVKKPAATAVKKPITTVAKAPVSKEKLVEIVTSLGNITVKLYDSMPQHRDNFIKLVKEGFYDSLLFHRVIEGFMIQGGDPDSRNAPDSIQLGMGEAPGGQRIPAEFNTNFYHKKGALAAARDNNPDKASSNCQFYIVQGRPTSNEELNSVECQVRQGGNGAFYYTDAQRKIYNSVGGAPFLDQNYTVFGEVVKGLDVVDKIATAAKDGNDRPLQNIKMKMRLLN